MRSAERVVALALALAAVVLVREAARLPIAWTAIGPGAGFFPFWLAVGVLASALVVLLKNLRAAPSHGGEPFIPPGAWRPLAVVLLPIAAVVGLMDLLGIYLGGALYLAGYMRLVGRHRWESIVLVAILLPLALFLIFERWFLLPMPKGTVLESLLYRR